MEPALTIPNDWRCMKSAELVALAAQIIGRDNFYPGDAFRIIETYVASSLLIDDKPAPPRGNGVTEALGGTQPDWFPSGSWNEG